MKKITLELSETQFAKFGISINDSPATIQEKFNESCARKIPLDFEMKCIETVDCDDEDIWVEGETYHVEYYDSIILADSEISSFCGTRMTDDDFMNCFEVSEATPAVAKAMCKEGFTDMFKSFLDVKNSLEIRNRTVTMPDSFIRQEYIL